MRCCSIVLPLQIGPSGGPGRCYAAHGGPSARCAEARRALVPPCVLFSYSAPPGALEGPGRPHSKRSTTNQHRIILFTDGCTGLPQSSFCTSLHKASEYRSLAQSPSHVPAACFPVTLLTACANEYSAPVPLRFPCLGAGVSGATMCSQVREMQDHRVENRCGASGDQVPNSVDRMATTCQPHAFQGAWAGAVSACPRYGGRKFIRPPLGHHSAAAVCHLVASRASSTFQTSMAFIHHSL
jgi:hypothetical protein